MNNHRRTVLNDFRMLLEAVFLIVISILLGFIVNYHISTLKG